MDMIQIMSSIYWFVLLTIVIIVEGNIYQNPSFVKQIINKKDGDEDNLTHEQRGTIIIALLFYLAFVLVSLFSSQWFPMLVMHTLLVLIPKKKRGNWLIKSTAIVEMIGTLFIVINRFHFHIDFWQMFSSLWQ